MTVRVMYETTFKCDLCGRKTEPSMGKRPLDEPPDDWRMLRTRIDFYHACSKHTFEEWGDFVVALGHDRPAVDYTAEF